MSQKSERNRGMPHRCNDRLEDAIQVRQYICAHAVGRANDLNLTLSQIVKRSLRFVSTEITSSSPQGLFEGDWERNFWPQVKLFRECMDSEVGKEPTAPYK